MLDFNIKQKKILGQIHKAGNSSQSPNSKGGLSYLVNKQENPYAKYLLNYIRGNPPPVVALPSGIPNTTAKDAESLHTHHSAAAKETAPGPFNALVENTGNALLPMGFSQNFKVQLWDKDGTEIVLAIDLKEFLSKADLKSLPKEVIEAFAQLKESYLSQYNQATNKERPLLIDENLTRIVVEYFTITQKADETYDSEAALKLEQQTADNLIASHPHDMDEDMTASSLSRDEVVPPSAGDAFAFQARQTAAGSEIQPDSIMSNAGQAGNTSAPAAKSTVSSPKTEPEFSSDHIEQNTVQAKSAAAPDTQKTDAPPSPKHEDKPHPGLIKSSVHTVGSFFGLLLSVVFGWLPLIGGSWGENIKSSWKGLEENIYNIGVSIFGSNPSAK